MRTKAFTLAETLIVIAIIGIVAVIAILGVQNSIMDNVRAKHTVASKHKFAKAIENMALNYDIGPYYGTGEDKHDASADFVNKLGQYYKINRICSTTNLDDCWGYQEIKFPNGKTYDITKATNGKLFKNGGNESLGDDYDVDTAGILGTDGTRFILAYNKNCKEVDPAVYVWTKDGTNNSATGCITSVIDIDGNKAPNMIGKDISFFNATSIGKNCVVELGDACFGALFVPVPLNVTGDDDPKCIELKRLGASYCAGNDDDYWGGAVLACGGTDFMPDDKSFAIFRQTYKKDMGTRNYTKGSATRFGLPEPPSDNSYIGIWLDYDTTGIGAGAFHYTLDHATIISDQRTYRSANNIAMCRIIE